MGATWELHVLLSEFCGLFISVNFWSFIKRVWLRLYKTSLIYKPKCRFHALNRSQMFLIWFWRTLIFTVTVDFITFVAVAFQSLLTGVFHLLKTFWWSVKLFTILDVGYTLLHFMCFNISILFSTAQVTDTSYMWSQNKSLKLEVQKKITLMRISK